MAITLTAGAVDTSKYVYPEEFFNIPHPTSPNVNIQFRTKINENSSDISNPDIWSNITFNPNNFFDNMTLEDESGAIKLSLNLIDQNHSFLEDKILRMTQVVNIENTKREKELKSIKVEDSATKDSVMIKSFITSQASIRIRFGYSSNSTNYFSSSSFNGFKKRIDDMNKPVINSPWIYFIITGMNVNVTENGLSADIEAVSENAPLLQNLKLVNVGLPLRGEAKEIIQMMGMFLKSEIKNLEVEIKDEPLVCTNEDGSLELTLDLGEFNSSGNFNFKTISSLLDDFCKLVHPVYFDKDGNKEIPISSYEEMEEKGEGEYLSYSYTWSFYDQTENPKLVFYYRKPDSKQKTIRTYTWIEHGQSVVRELSLTSEYLFSQLNIPLFKISTSGDHAIYTSSSKEDGSNTFKNLTKELNNESFSFTFVKDSYHTFPYEEENRNKKAGVTKITNIGANLNNMLHTGTLTIQGDPFYLFDDVMSPFMYKIRVIVKKPTYIDETGNRVGGGKSYLSGEYVIKKITHEVSAGDFTTKLEIQRAL